MITTVMLTAYLGRERPALEQIEALEREAEHRALGRAVGVAECARATLHNSLGHHPAALQAAERALTYRDISLHPWALIEFVEAAVRTGDHDAAAEGRDRLGVWAECGTPRALGGYVLADALVATTGASGDRSDFIQGRFREAIEHFEGGGVGVLLTRSRLLFGEWLRRENQRTQARSELRAAHEAATAIGMEAFAERARRELLATGETVAKRSGGAVVLTPQEVQIGRLVVAGHSNAEVGGQLFLSPRTVEWHLRKIFTKLGISSRRELDGSLLVG